MPAVTFTIPSIFKAIDGISAPMKAMGKSVQDFASKAEAGIARSERMFNRLTPSIGGAAKQLLSFATTAAITAGIVSTVHFSTKSLMDYETAVQSFRTIVGGTDETFSKYQAQINQVAKDTKKSAVDVAASFENIAGLNAKFAETAEGIGEVSKAAILLSKASRDDLATSAQNLVGIMNQFSKPASEATDTINVLAAGAAVGASSITKTSEAFVNFGSVAAGANISLEKSVALVQVLGKFSIFGAEAGTKLRGSVLKLQQAGLGYASGQFDINDALAEANKRLEKLSTAKQKDAAILKMFGAENISTGKILLNNVALFDEYTKGVTGTNAVVEAAALNSATLTVKLDEMKNKWVNIITSSDGAASSLNTVKNVIGFLTDNMETIVSIGTKILLFFAAWKALLIISKVVMIGYNIALGVMGALSGTASVAIGANAIALGAYKVVLAIVTAAQWAWNAAMLANPIGLIIVAVAALIALVVVVIRKWDEWGAALSLFMGPLGIVISLVQSFRRNWDMVTQAFTEGGILAGLKAIGVTLLDAVLMPLQQLLKIIAAVTGADWATSAMNSIEQFRKDLGVNVETPAVNPEQAKQDGIRETISTQRQNVAIDIRDQTGRAQMTNDNPLIPINLTSTMGMQPG